MPKASGCVPARELEAEVEAMLGRQVFTEPSHADHTLTGTVEQRGELWVAALRLVTRAGTTDGTREINAVGECASLNRPLVIVITTMLDTSTSDEMLLKSKPDPTLALGLALAGDVGTLPRPALGAGVFAELTPSAAWPIARIGFTGFLPERVASGGIGARFLALSGGFALCPRLFAHAALRIHACAGPELGMVNAQALGLDPPRAPSRLLVAVMAEANVSIQLVAHVRMQLGVDLLVAMLRPGFYFQDETAHKQVVHRVGRWAGGLRFGFIADAF